MKFTLLLLILGIFLIGVYSLENNRRRQEWRGTSTQRKGANNQKPSSYRTRTPQRKRPSIPTRKQPVYDNTPKYLPEPTSKPSRPIRPVGIPKGYKKSSIPGVPGKDYPTFNIPSHDFDCHGKVPGYYADIKTRCQTYHVCLRNGGKRSFLCVNGTVFNQRVLSCDWWNRVNCQESPNFYDKNAEIGRETPSSRRSPFSINPRKG